MCRLQARAPVAEHRIDRQASQKAGEAGEKLVVRAEHHGRAEDGGACEFCPHRRFAFAAAADVARARAGIGADAGEVNKAHDSGLPRAGCHARRRLDMDGMKCPAAALDIEADGIHHAVGTRDRALDGVAIVYIGSHQLKARRVLRHVTRCHPDGESMSEQMLDHVPAQEAGPAEHHDEPIRHGLLPQIRCAPAQVERHAPVSGAIAELSPQRRPRRRCIRFVVD